VRALSGVLALLALLLAAPTTAPNQAFPLRPGDRVVFVGDSITQQRLYTTYLETYFLTRFPNWRLQFRNVGWSGDTAWLARRTSLNESHLFSRDSALVARTVCASVDEGLRRDVLALKPTLAFLCFGMNDSRLGERAVAPYSTALRESLHLLTSSGARAVVLSPSPEQPRQPGSRRNARLLKLTAAGRQEAARAGVSFADLFNPVLQVLRQGLALDPSLALIPDAVHPAPPGHLAMAWATLRELDAPSLVSRVDFNAASRSVRCQGCRAAQVRVGPREISFRRQDDCLPWPLPPSTRSVWALTRVQEELNRYELRVTGLRPGSYRLEVNGSPLGVFHSRDLAAGLNLSRYPQVAGKGPELQDAVCRKNDLYFERWRHVQLGNHLSPKDRERRLAALDAGIEALETRIDRLRRPKPLTFRLVWEFREAKGDGG
jgi:lysophospholipase L1-like esterase